MRVEAVEGDGHRVRGKALHFQLAAFAAVECVGARRAEPADIEVVGAPTDLLVRRERDPHRAVRDLRVRQEMLRRAHDLRDARLVIRPEQRRPRRRDHVIADLLAEFRMVVDPKHRIGRAG
jgi:hypothetical protein